MIESRRRRWHWAAWGLLAACHPVDETPPLGPRLALGTGHGCLVSPSGAVRCFGFRPGNEVEVGRGVQEVSAPVPTVDLGRDARVEAVAAGVDHTCAVLTGGRVKCWGRNVRGQLGLGDTVDRGMDPSAMGDALPAVNLGTSTAVRQVSCGFQHCCALLASGGVKCWGANDFGQLGLGDVETRGDGPEDMGDALPVLDLGNTVITAVSCGGVHSCALFTTGVAKCWGLFKWGRLGFAGKDDNPGDEPGEMGGALRAVETGEEIPIASVAAGNRHTCAMFVDGRVKCWGKNSDDICDDDPSSPCGLVRFDAGRLGIGDPYDRFNGVKRPSVDLGADVEVTAVSAGFLHTCARVVDGGVKCWGANRNGQLGLGDDEDRGYREGQMGDDLALVDLGRDGTVLEVVAGSSETCALLADERVKCWGRGFGGNHPDEMGDALPAVPLD